MEVGCNCFWNEVIAFLKSITLADAIGIYGAAISTILLIGKFTKEYRRVKIILEFQEWTETMQMIIVNTGHRPVNISNISMKIFIFHTTVESNQKSGGWEQVPANVLFESRDGRSTPSLPAKIQDGEQLAFDLSEICTEYILQSNWKVKILVRDIEGHVFVRIEKRSHDMKWGKVRKI